MNELTIITTNALSNGQSGRIDQHPAAVYLAGLSPSSRETMAQALDIIARIVAGDSADRFTIPWAAIRFQHAAAIRAELAERYSHATANKMLSALRGALKAAWKLGLMSAEDFHAAASVDRVRGESVPAGREVPTGELVALLDTCEQNVLGVRDAAILSVLYGCGLRRGEVVNLGLSDYDAESGRLVVSGKGNKKRFVPVVNGTAAALGDWLNVRGDDPGPLFWGTGNRNRRGKLTTQAIYKMLSERAGVAKVKRLSPHDFRRTFVSELLDRGADIVTVQKLAGHANVETTARYDRRGEQAKAKAAALLHVPYTKRTIQA